jgi:phosphoribosylformylglycinamidine synthase
VNEPVPVQGESLSDRTEWVADVTVMPKQGVNDPEGEAILGGLHQLGYAGVTRVRAGRLLSLTLMAQSEAEARHLAEAMCRQLLANPVIESYQIDLIPAITAAGATS